MLRRLPVVPTVVVIAAIATMIALGVWQLQRATWKNDLLARYAANRDLPPIPFPSTAADTRDLLYRRAHGMCANLEDVRVTAGRDATGASGWSHIATCGTRGRAMTVDIGWSAAFDAPVDWRGGSVTGVIAPDTRAGIRLVATDPAPGLKAGAPPGTDEIPNNHLFYAVQWFFFAALAALIYVLALHQRSTQRPKVPAAR